MFNPEMLPHVTPPQADVKSGSAGARKILEDALHNAMSMMMQDIVDDPSYPEEKKEPVRVMLAFEKTKRLMNGSLIKLGDPERIVTDDLRYARCEAVQVMSQFIQSAEELIFKYPDVFNEI